MRLLIAAFGRWKASPERALFEHYIARAKAGGWAVELKELHPLPAATVAEQQTRETAVLLASAQAFRADKRIFLDETGRDLTSPQFARLLGDWRDRSDQRIAFLIGGDVGLDKKELAAADAALCLGKLTWPHLLVRALLAEQIYRAQTILAGHPYHRVKQRPAACNLATWALHHYHVENLLSPHVPVIASKAKQSIRP